MAWVAQSGPSISLGSDLELCVIARGSFRETDFIETDDIQQVGEMLHRSEAAEPAKKRRIQANPDDTDTNLT